MKVKDLVALIFDDVSIYKIKESDQLDFEDLFKGKTSNIPATLLNMEVKSIGVTNKNIIDIKV